VCGELLETLALFQTKICSLLYQISDPTQNSITYFRPDPSKHVSNANPTYPIQDQSATDLIQHAKRCIQ